MVRFNRFLCLPVRFVLIGLMTLALVLGSGAIAYGQLPSLPASGNSAFSTPDGVRGRLKS